MKKIKAKKKKFLINRTSKQLRRRRRRRKLKYGRPKPVDQIRRIFNPEFKTVLAPKVLNLQYESVEKSLKFVEKIKRIGNKGYFVNLNLENVKTISEGAISLLLSVISDLERKRVFFSGEKPFDSEARDVLERSGFFKHMTGSVSSKNKVSKNKILKTGNISTHQQEFVPEIHKAMETVWGTKARCPALYGGLGEMMRNSCDHAFLDKRAIVWHFGISHFEQENMCKFSFVDNGEGIINTYYHKGLINEAKRFFNNTAEILETAFRDGIKSRTGLSWRGKGLPTIFEMYEDNIITNLIVITNDVYLDFDRKITKTLNTRFSGTYYFWRITNTCEPSYFQIA